MSITFAVDDVTPAAAPLPTRPLRELAPDALLVGGDPETPVVDHRGVHPLLAAVHVAFSQHRALVLSPDVLWLTIAQGFAQHIRLHAETLRPRLVRHAGRGKIVVGHQGPPPRDPAGLGQLLDEVREGLAREVGEGMPRLFVCDFSTTTEVERIASEVVLLDAYSPYFDYAVTCVCGIPEVTLLGAPEDYRKIRQRIDVLCELDLEFWRPSLVRIADALVETAEGRPDRDFWRAIYKPREAYGWDLITGWIARLYPYLKTTYRVDRRNPFLAVKFKLGESSAKGQEPVGIQSIQVPDTLSRALIDIRDLTCEPGRRFAFELEAGVTHVAQESGKLTPRAGYFLREHERSIHEVIERIRAEHHCEPPIPGGEHAFANDGASAEVVALYDHMSSAVLFEGPRCWRLRKLEVVGDGLRQRLRGSIVVLGGRYFELRPLFELPDGRVLCEVPADRVFTCIRAADVKYEPDGHEEVDEVTGLMRTGEERWTLTAARDQLPIVARNLSDLLMRVLNDGPDVELSALGVLRDMDEECRRELNALLRPPVS
jgi:hypothetical protein